MSRNLWMRFSWHNKKSKLKVKDKREDKTNKLEISISMISLLKENKKLFKVKSKRRLLLIS
jgi:hypothetical protein